MKGNIKNIAQKQQINEFAGFRVGNITPTDIDGLVEYKNIGYVIFEVKHSNTPVPYGQKVALERMVNDFERAGKHAIVFVVEHDVRDTDKSVNVPECYVREIYYKGKWKPPLVKCTASKAYRHFINICDDTMFLNRREA